MKYASIIVAVLAIVLAGWIFMRGDEPAPQPTAIEERSAITETEAPAPAEPPADDAADQILVEESAGDEEAAVEDQPIILAQADTSTADRDWQFSEGNHYTRLVPTQPTVGGSDEIEVAEFFWYGCNHCNDFEPYINRWDENKPDGVRFVRIHAMWNPLVQIHAQLYYTEEVLATTGKLDQRETFRNTVFAEYHRRGNRMASVDAVYEIFERFDVSRADFDNAWNSFEVSQKMRVADDLARRYGVTSVPMVFVNGKYKTDAGAAGSYPKLLELVDELIEREKLIR